MKKFGVLVYSNFNYPKIKMFNNKEAAENYFTKVVQKEFNTVKETHDKIQMVSQDGYFKITYDSPKGKNIIEFFILKINE